MDPNDTIRYHESLAKCEGWVAWLRPSLEKQLATAIETARRGATPEDRETARHRSNVLEDVLTDITEQFQTAARALHAQGKLPAYLHGSLRSDPMAVEPAAAHSPAAVPPSDFDITTFGSTLIANYLPPPVNPPATSP